MIYDSANSHGVSQRSITVTYDPVGLVGLALPATHANREMLEHSDARIAEDVFAKRNEPV